MWNMATVFVLGYQNLTEWIQQYFFLLYLWSKSWTSYADKVCPCLCCKRFGKKGFPSSRRSKKQNPFARLEKSFTKSHFEKRLKMTVHVRSKISTRSKFPWEKSSGLLIGRMTSSFKAFLTSSRAPTSLNLTPISPGATTADTKLLSYSSLAKFWWYLYPIWISTKYVRVSTYSNHREEKMYKHAFKFCDGFSDMVSCSFNLTIAISRLPMKKNTYQLLGAKTLTTYNHGIGIPFTRQRQSIPFYAWEQTWW